MLSNDYQAFVILNEDELAAIRLLADRRYRNNREAGILGYQNTTKHEGIVMESMSLAGEWGFAKLFNTYPPLNQDPELAGSPDFVSPKGFLIEVKTGAPDKDLCVNRFSTRKRRDFYVLMESKKVRGGLMISFIGYTNYHAVTNAKLIESGASPFYMVPRNELGEFSTFRDSIWVK
jgi:hypothetical protein